jgi:hypothetical protein
MVTVNHAPQVAGLQICLINTMVQIDAALDSGDRRAFRVWTSRWASLTRRLENLLLKIATAADPT